jgi:uncharacterized protein (DUF1800 family)
MPRIFLRAFVAFSIAASLPGLWAQETAADRAQIVHVLNRITFGPRPGDVEAVQKMGLQNYIQQQLHPETINDSAVDQQITSFAMLQMSPQELTDIFLDERKKAMKKQKLLAANAGQSPVPGDIQPPSAPAMSAPAPATKEARIADQVGKANQIRSIAAVGELEEAKLMRAIESNRQLQEVLVDFWGNHFNIDVKKGPDRVYKIVDDRDVIRPHVLGRFRDMLEASAKSPAMLWYLDNYLNSASHNVTPMEAMITQRVADKMMENGNGALAPEVPKVGQKKGGPNENYGREIMELHTLGVDGGYTQKDVQEVARCFTGWTIERQTGAFMFRPRQHDDGVKVVLGHTIPAGGGMQDGEMVLDILSSNPATAHHLAFELCQRFVSDTPPAALVDRIAGVFTQTNGDLRKVTEAILTSPEFLSPTDYNTKIKSPLEFAVSAVRASESTMVRPTPPFDKLAATLDGAGVIGRGGAADRIAKRPRQSISYHILELGQPLFACTPPTGYSEISRFWVSPGALIERLNFAMALTAQNLSDVTFNPKNVLGNADLDNPDAVLNQCASVLLQNNITDSTRKVLETTALPKEGESKTVNPTKLIALIIGSPEFQRK